jgi:hypothetical protein
MTCTEFERILEEAQGVAMPAEARVHAATCPQCAFALRLEMTLREAPRWTLHPRLSVERRATLLARARVQTHAPEWFGSGPLLEQSALNALVTLTLLMVGVYGLPFVLKGSLPAPLFERLSQGMEPLTVALKGLVAPLLQQPWGLVILAAAGFSLCFAAALSARLYGDLRRA